MYQVTLDTHREHNAEKNYSPEHGIVYQVRPPRSGGGSAIASATDVANATVATPTSSSLRPEMMAVEALGGMVSALSVAAAATAAKGREASEKYGSIDGGEAELAETVLRGKSISLSSQLPRLLHAYLLQFLLHQ